MNLDEAIQSFLIALHQSAEAERIKRGYKIEKGRKYARIVSYLEQKQDDGSIKCAHISSYCFIDMSNGNILKADSWKIPSKILRGFNVFKPESYQGKMDPYGSWLYIR